MLKVQWKQLFDCLLIIFFFFSSCHSSCSVAHQTSVVECHWERMEVDGRKRHRTLRNIMTSRKCWARKFDWKLLLINALLFTLIGFTAIVYNWIGIDCTTFLSCLSCSSKACAAQEVAHSKPERRRHPERRFLNFLNASDFFSHGRVTWACW